VQALILDISNAVNSNFASTLSQNDGFDHHVLNILLEQHVCKHGESRKNENVRLQAILRIGRQQHRVAAQQHSAGSLVSLQGT